MDKCGPSAIEAFGPSFNDVWMKAAMEFCRRVADSHEHKWRCEHCKYCGVEFSSWTADMQNQARSLLRIAEDLPAPGRE